MRQIKFRGKDENTHDWKFGALVVINGHEHIIEENDIEMDGHHFRQKSDCPTWVEKETVGQFTGLKDKNGVDIYEGDIVSFYDEVEDDILSGTVVYDTDDCSFCLKRNGYENAPLVRYWQYEVIGNIYDKKLLEEEK